jgi:hypothetical protein
MIEQSAIKKMEEIMLSYLTKDMDPASVGFVHIEYEENEESIEEGTAYTTTLGQCALTQLKAFEISYDPQLKEDLKLFTTMLAHELIHVMQVLRGDVFDYSKPYREQPHEIEAYGREDEVATHYLTLMRRGNTK